jgi:hypothetical protein
LEIKGKDFKLTPLPLKTVRPFVIDEINLGDVAEEEGLNLNDQMEITKYLKAKVSSVCSHMSTCANDGAGQLLDRRSGKTMGGTQCQSH